MVMVAMMWLEVDGDEGGWESGESGGRRGRQGGTGAGIKRCICYISPAVHGASGDVAWDGLAYLSHTRLGSKPARCIKPDII